jgi:hypothetical protein
MLFFASTLFWVTASALCGVAFAEMVQPPPPEDGAVRFIWFLVRKPLLLQAIALVRRCFSSLHGASFVVAFVFSMRNGVPDWTNAGSSMMGLCFV